MRIANVKSRNANFERFVSTAKSHCLRRGIRWDITVDENGQALSGSGWDLNAITQTPRVPKGTIVDFGLDRNALLLLAKREEFEGKATPQRKMSDDWMELCKAVVIDWIIVQKNKCNSVYDRRLRPLRILAACAISVPPWELTVLHVRKALEICAELGNTTKASVETVVSLLFDLYNLSNNCPLLSLSLDGTGRTEIGKPSIRQDLSCLEERSSAEKLPEIHAFWELVRIVFTERPQTFLDGLLFDHCKLLICTGFRVTESCMIPAKWDHVVEANSADGRSMETLGGVGHYLYVRNFAEKNRGKLEDSERLVESIQYVPRQFEEIIREALDGVRSRTQPMRERLRLQQETGRLFPEYRTDDLVPVAEFYPRLSGNMRLLDDQLPDLLVEKYKVTNDVALLDEIWASQCRPAHRFRTDVVKYFYQFGNKACGRSGQMFPARRADGTRWKQPITWVDAYVKVGELEEVIPKAMPRKMPDLVPYRLSNDKPFYPHEMLFLAPKVAIAEQRNGALLDVVRYFSVGMVDGNYLSCALGLHKTNLFSKYGSTEVARKFTLTKTHPFRHLMNTEMFRGFLQDTIISKQFNRRSIAQNAVYDHRSHDEFLASIDLPKSTLRKLPEKARTTLKMIVSGKVAGRIVDEFKKIQAAEGEDAALRFLAAEADGFHATPYGYCINSFTVDPCPKHLECFNGCRHLTISEDQTQQSNLEKIEHQLSVALAAIQARKSTAIGRQNQLVDVQRKLGNVRLARSVGRGKQPFPKGQDLSVRSKKRRTVLDD